MPAAGTQYPQAAYGYGTGPGGPGPYGPPPAEKKSRTGLIVGIVVGVVVVAAIAVGAFFLLNKKDDKATTTTTQTTQGSMLSSTTKPKSGSTTTKPNSGQGAGVPLDAARIEDEIATGISTQTGLTAVVDCPSTMVAAQGDTFTCDVLLSDGNQAVVLITAQDNVGNVKWELKSS